MTKYTCKDLEIWKKSVVFVKKVYELAEKLPKSEEYNLKSQLKRAVVSVALNIAEGKSGKSSKEFLNFLNISYASLSEVEAILALSSELGYLDNMEDVVEGKEVLCKMINSLRGSLSGKNYEK